MGSQSNFHGCRTPRCAYVLVVKTRCLGRFWLVSWTTTQFRGPEIISTIVQPRVCLRVGHRQSQFWLILVRFVHYYSAFWDPEGFPRLTIPGVLLHVHCQHSQFWPILTCFVDYDSPFWGPEVISIVVEPQGAITCRSSTLTILVDSGPFLGILLSILGSQSNFHD